MTLYRLLCFPDLSIRLDQTEIAGNQLTSQYHLYYQYNLIVAIVDSIRIRTSAKLLGLVVRYYTLPIQCIILYVETLKESSNIVWRGV